jgi:hypothetical protein
MAPDKWNLSSIRLPRLIDQQPGSERLLEHLLEIAAPLWKADSIRVPQLPVSEALLGAIRGAEASKTLVRGLEAAERKLADEQRGLGMVDRRTGQARGSRLSRLIIVTDDGSERFYRQVERILNRYGARLLALRIQIDGAQFGTQIFGAPAPVRAVLLTHKDAVSAALLATL